MSTPTKRHFLKEARERLVGDGMLKEGSDLDRILRAVIEHGAADLGLQDRSVFEGVIIPLVGTLEL